jgi:outer membrane protein
MVKSREALDEVRHHSGVNRAHLLLPLLALSVFLLQPGALLAGDLEVVLRNPPAGGSVAFVLFNTPNTFGDFRDPFRAEVVTAENSASHRFTDLPPGEYALLVFHDRNSNRQLDKNFIGIPIEPIGFSKEYDPRGPPQFERARFVLGDEDSARMEVTLARILGKHGTWGLGLGVIYQSSPYRGSNEQVLKPIPAFTYVGNRLQIGGPSLRYALLGQDKYRLAAAARYRVGAYDESDSPYLAGMGDRENTVMAGLNLVSELPGGFNLILGYEHDVLGNIGGGMGEAALRKTFQWGPVSVSPAVRLNWLSADVANYDFGVSAEQAAADRPEYQPGSSINPEIGVTVYAELGGHWILQGNLGVDFLDSGIKHSPIVDQHQRYHGYLSVFYLF